MPSRFDIVCDAERWRAQLHDNVVGFAVPALSLRIHALGDDRYRIDGLPGGPIEVVAARAGSAVWASVAGDVFELRATAAGSAHASTGDADALTPPMPATVVHVAVREGQPVREGDLLISLEAMKMALPIRAPRDGVVRAIHCREGELVQPGTVLVEL